MLDSGTTFTYLPADVFRIFMELVTKHALGKGLHIAKGPDPKVGSMRFALTSGVMHCIKRRSLVTCRAFMLQSSCIGT